MKILDFSYDNSFDGWHLKNVQFDDINLLVGLSGVGKTRILKSILGLRNIANGRTLNGIKWSVNFIDSNNKKYNWNGEFSSIQNIDYDDDNDDLKENKPMILSEILICDGETLIKRDNDQLTYKGEKSPKLLPL